MLRLSVKLMRANNKMIVTERHRERNSADCQKLFVKGFLAISCQVFNTVTETKIKPIDDTESDETTFNINN